MLQIYLCLDSLRPPQQTPPPLSTPQKTPPHHLNKHLLLYQHLKKHLLLYQQTPPPLSPPQQTPPLSPPQKTPPRLSPPQQSPPPLSPPQQSLLDTQQMLEELPQPFSTLNTSEHHRSIRELADKHYRKNAEKMKLQYAKKKRHQVVTFSSGDNVTLRIPRNERSSSDMPRLLCRVLEVKRGQHRLQ